MVLTNDNYFSPEASWEYMSVSQFKSFLHCEAQTMAALRGELPEQEKSTALLVGSYIDSYFEGTLEQFKNEHPEIYLSRGTNKGGLKAEYQQAEDIIKRIERDELFMKFMSGKKQVIETAELYGIKWKTKIDVLNEDSIVDLKIMRDMQRTWRGGNQISFVEAWGYNIQGAVYQEIHYRKTGERLPFYIACATKEAEPDIEIIHIPDDHLKQVLQVVEANAFRISAVKDGIIAPHRCGGCNYCRSTKVLTEPIDFQLVGVV